MALFQRSQFELTTIVICDWSPRVDEVVAVFFAYDISRIFRQRYFRPHFSAITLLYASFFVKSRKVKQC